MDNQIEEPKVIGAPSPLSEQVQDALYWLKGFSNQGSLDALQRIGIPTDHAFGVPRETIKLLGKKLGRNHALAVALWDTGVYEAQMLVPMIGDPALVTPEQMDHWCKEVDNWAVCDGLCFNFLERSPHAWSKVELWSGWAGEFEKRTAFALLWGLAGHDKLAGNESFLNGLQLIEREAGDDRHFVKKAVNMALRSIGKRDRELNIATVAVASRLAESSDKTKRWVGRDALRELTKPELIDRLG